MERCFGNNSALYAQYHDEEWAVPSYDDQYLFEMLVLEGAQAGLSWETVLNKRQGYKEAFYNFNIAKVAAMSDEQLEVLRHNPQIIRNRLKIAAARKNAQVVLAIQQEYGSLSTYLWGYVNNQPILNDWEGHQQVPANTPISDALSKDLKKRGMSFVGTTIMYAFMQAVGMVNDHISTCPCYHAHSK